MVAAMVEMKLASSNGNLFGMPVFRPGYELPVAPVSLVAEMDSRPNEAWLAEALQFAFADVIVAEQEREAAVAGEGPNEAWLSDALQFAFGDVVVAVVESNGEVNWL